MRLFSITAILFFTLPAMADMSTALEDAWPRTDLAASGLQADLLMVKGTRNVIPPHNDPSFVPLSFATHVGQLAPVIEVTIDGRTKLYPLAIVAAHAIINDTLNGVPIAVSYCRVCASPMVFKRVVGGQETRLGFTGVAYEDNLVMFDEASETWWQQINGLGLAGRYGTDELEVIPSKLKSLEHAKQDARGSTLVLAHSDYSRDRVLPTLNVADGPQTAPIYVNLQPDERVVVVQEQAYRLSDIAAAGEIVDGDLVLRHRPGRYAGPDAFLGTNANDIGTIDVLRRADGGARLSEEAYRINLGHALDNLRKGRIELRDFAPKDDPYAPERRVNRDN